MKHVVSSVCLLLMIALIVCGATYSCVDTNRSYNERATKCIERGGSWVTNSNGDQCITPRN